MDEDVNLPEVPEQPAKAGAEKKKSSKSSAKPQPAPKPKSKSGTSSGSTEKSSAEPAPPISESSDSSASPTPPGESSMSDSIPAIGAESPAVEERVDILAVLKSTQNSLHAFQRQVAADGHTMSLMRSHFELFGKSLVALHNALVKSGYCDPKKEPSDHA